VSSVQLGQSDFAEQAIKIIEGPAFAPKSTIEAAKEKLDPVKLLLY
jgi:hypothetical protein